MKPINHAWVKSDETLGILNFSYLIWDLNHIIRVNSNSQPIRQAHFFSN